MLTLIGLMIVVSTFGIPVNAESKRGSEQNRLEQLINKTKQEIKNEKKKEKSVLGNLLKQQKELDGLEKQYDKFKTQLGHTQNQLYITKQELRSLRKDLYQLEMNLESRRQLLNSRLVAVYKYGPQTYFEILMTAKKFGDFISRFCSIAYFVRNDMSTIVQFSETKEEITEQQVEIEIKKKQVESEYQKIAILQKNVFQEQRKIVSKVQTTGKELAKIQNNRANLEKALEEYEQTSREIEAQIRKGQVVEGKVLGTGHLSWPAQGRISSRFGWRFHPVLKRQKLHNGLDIAIPSGTSVYAADSGVVLVSGWRGGYGNYVAIDHGGGISTGYAHNSRLLVKVGETVSKGQKITLSGNTGLSSGPHLHFEVRINGVPTDPTKYLPK